MSQYIRKASKRLLPELTARPVDFLIPTKPLATYRHLHNSRSELAYWPAHRVSVRKWFGALRKRKLSELRDDPPAPDAPIHRPHTILLAIPDLIELEMEMTFGALSDPLADYPFSSSVATEICAEDISMVRSAISVARHGRSFVYYTTTSLL